jgi:hypothetical protein
VRDLRSDRSADNGADGVAEQLSPDGVSKQLQPERRAHRNPDQLRADRISSVLWDERI